jgi:predicted DNA-binding protein
MEEIVTGYKNHREKKVDLVYCRVDDSMLGRLTDIRKRTGISTSEIIREAVRRLIHEIDTTGSFTLKMN